MAEAVRIISPESPECFSKRSHISPATHCVVMTSLNAGMLRVSMDILGRRRRFNRKAEEPLSGFLARVRASTVPKAKRRGVAKPCNTRKNMRPSTVSNADDGAPSFIFAVQNRDGQVLPDEISIGEALRAGHTFHCSGTPALVMPIAVDPPTIMSVAVHGRPFKGITVRPLVATLNDAEVDIEWQRLPRVPGKGESPHTAVGKGDSYTPINADVGHALRVRCTPYRQGPGDQRVYGEPVDAIFKVKVSTPPPFVDRSGLNDRKNLPAGALRVVSYNLLANCHADTAHARENVFPYCAPEVLDEGYRLPLCIRELQAYDGDVVALQEVDGHNYRHHIEPHFSSTHHTAYLAKTGAAAEGCALLLRRSRFDIERIDEISLSDVFARTAAGETGHGSETGAATMRAHPHLKHILTRGISTVAQVAVVRDKLTSPSENRCVIVNTHLFYHPAAPHVRVLQMAAILELVGKARGSDGVEGGVASVIVAGDLNTRPHAMALELLATGRVSATHVDWLWAPLFRWGRESKGEGGGVRAQSGGGGNGSCHVAGGGDTGNRASSEILSVAQVAAAASELEDHKAQLARIQRALDANGIADNSAGNGAAVTVDAHRTARSVGDEERRLLDVIDQKTRWLRGMIRVGASERAPGGSDGGGGDGGDDAHRDDEPAWGEPLFHDLNLVSASGCPEYTNVVSGFCDTLDWVFVSRDRFQVLGHAAVPPRSEVFAHTALPSPIFPSDHIALVADILPHKADDNR